MSDTKTMTGKVEKSEVEWRKELTPMQYAVLREKATERPFSGEYEHEQTPGTYTCAGCGQTLFESDAKFDSGCGWPSFTQPALESHVDEERDVSHGMVRTEVLCSKCNGHLVITGLDPVIHLRKKLATKMDGCPDQVRA